MSEPQQQPTPEKTPGKGEGSEVSTTEADDQGYESRSRSQSRRRRRQNQRQKQAQSKSQSGAQAGNASAQSQSMAKIREDPQETDEHPATQLANRPPEEQDNPQWLHNPDPRDITETQPFERIKPPSQSMMGPVTYARMIRGEIPWRGPPPSQPIETAQNIDSKDSSGKDPMDQDGLKLRIELNLDIEIELKASIHGDITLALLN